MLKRRLERRLAAVGITVTKVHEEEWSYIPVGGPMPLQDQTITAFGAAANLVHPATGFSVTRSLREAPALAEQIQQVWRAAWGCAAAWRLQRAAWGRAGAAAQAGCLAAGARMPRRAGILARAGEGGPASWLTAATPAPGPQALAADRAVGETSAAVWRALWPEEKCRQASFHVFGMELLAALDLAATNQFFNTFFSLPSFYWRGFLASNLSSAQLVAFALLTFALAPVRPRACARRGRLAAACLAAASSCRAAPARDADAARRLPARPPPPTAQVGIKAKLVSHLLTDPAGKYLAKHYLESSGAGGEQQQVAAALLLMYLGGAATQLQ